MRKTSPQTDVAIRALAQIAAAEHEDAAARVEAARLLLKHARKRKLDAKR